MQRGAVILCGGKSTRLGLPLSKCLLPLGNTTLVQEQIKMARALGATKIFLSANEESILPLSKIAAQETGKNKASVAIYLNSAQNFMGGLLQIEQFFSEDDEVLVMMGDNSYPSAVEIEIGSPGYLKEFRGLDCLFTYSQVSSSQSNGPRLFRTTEYDDIPGNHWHPVWGPTPAGEIYQGFVLANSGVLFNMIRRTSPSRRRIIEIVDVLNAFIVFGHAGASIELPGYFNEITTLLDYVRLKNLYEHGESSQIYTSGAGVIVYRYPKKAIISSGTMGRVSDCSPEALILRRADNGLWGIPGGVIDVGEQPIEAALREAREETGLELGELTPIGCYQIKNKAGDPAIIALYSAEAENTEGKELQANSEATTFAWIIEEVIGEFVFANQNDFLIKEFFNA